ncbi:shTK domain protein [Teladorsagia circumcincta]|uniref:ShTK domain protein n=1 Tax=Teladorsagia circumcincta TaxID=45464 RepID=A0A2G9TPN0_TELCI|nr:shTK domain protein [Teladorsagia circumcincta]
MLSYVLIALLLLNVFTEEGAVAKEVKPKEVAHKETKTEGAKTKDAKTDAPKECKDLSRICDKHKKDGLCDSTDKDRISMMKTSCKKTCGFCKEK